MASGDNNNDALLKEEIEEARRLGEETVDDVLQTATRSLDNSTQEEQHSPDAEALKEHDVPDEEATEASRIEAELARELQENGGWVKILGNDELMKKVRQDLLVWVGQQLTITYFSRCFKKVPLIKIRCVEICAN